MSILNDIMDRLTDEYSPERLFDTGMPEPNCRVRLSGRHYYTDRVFYINPYGVTFYDMPDTSRDNPFVAASHRNSLSVLDHYFDEPFMPPIPTAPLAPSETEARILRQMDEKYVCPDSSDCPREVYRLACDCEGRISRNGDSILLSYGTIVPTVLCLRGQEHLSADFAFSPISDVTFERGARVAQTMPFTLPAFTPCVPPEEITVDFSVHTDKLSNDLTVEHGGRLELSYSVIVGTTRCEVTQLTVEVRRLPRHAFY